MKVCIEPHDFNQCARVLVAIFVTGSTIPRGADQRSSGIMGRLLLGIGSWDTFLTKYTSCPSSFTAIVMEEGGAGLMLLQILLQYKESNLTVDATFFGTIILSQTLLTQLITRLTISGEPDLLINGSPPEMITALLNSCIDRILDTDMDQLSRTHCIESFIRSCCEADIFNALEQLFAREGGELRTTGRSLSPRKLCRRTLMAL